MKEQTFKIFQIIAIIGLTITFAYLLGESGHRLISTFVTEFIKTALG